MVVLKEAQQQWHVCTYTTLDNNYAFFNLEWYKGDSLTDPSTIVIADFFNAATTPSLYNTYTDTSRYLVSRDNDNSISTFDLISVDLGNDSGRYWCLVQLKPSGGSVLAQQNDSTESIVFSE